MAGDGRSAGVLRLALAFALVLAGLALVVRRQSRALELVRAVERARAERALAEAQRAELLQRIDWLQSRGRVMAVVAHSAMRPPTGAEIVILPETLAPATSVTPATPVVPVARSAAVSAGAVAAR